MRGSEVVQQVEGLKDPMLLEASMHVTCEETSKGQDPQVPSSPKNGRPEHALQNEVEGSFLVTAVDELTVQTVSSPARVVISGARPNS